jgi:hypothetical protein
VLDGLRGEAGVAELCRREGIAESMYYSWSKEIRRRVGSSITEGTANFLINRRMNKSQQMRWSRKGADLLLQVRCAVYNGALGSSFGRLFHSQPNRAQTVGQGSVTPPIFGQSRCLRACYE